MNSNYFFLSASFPLTTSYRCSENAAEEPHLTLSAFIGVKVCSLASLFHCFYFSMAAFMQNQTVVRDHMAHKDKTIYHLVL